MSDATISGSITFDLAGPRLKDVLSGKYSSRQRGVAALSGGTGAKTLPPHHDRFTRVMSGVLQTLSVWIVKTDHCRKVHTAQGAGFKNMEHGEKY